MTETPQITRIMMNSHDGPPKANPIARAQAPDAIIIPAVVAVRPIRSDRIPPRRQPNAPVPIVTKVTPGRATTRAGLQGPRSRTPEAMPTLHTAPTYVRNSRDWPRGDLDRGKQPQPAA